MSSVNNIELDPIPSNKSIEDLKISQLKNIIIWHKSQFLKSSSLKNIIPSCNNIYSYPSNSSKSGYISSKCLLGNLLRLPQNTIDYKHVVPIEESKRLEIKNNLINKHDAHAALFFDSIKSQYETELALAKAALTKTQPEAAATAGVTTEPVSVAVPKKILREHAPTEVKTEKKEEGENFLGVDIESEKKSLMIATNNTSLASETAAIHESLCKFDLSAINLRFTSIAKKQLTDSAINALTLGLRMHLRNMLSKLITISQHRTEVSKLVVPTTITSEPKKILMEEEANLGAKRKLASLAYPDKEDDKNKKRKGNDDEMFQVEDDRIDRDTNIKTNLSQPKIRARQTIVTLPDLIYLIENDSKYQYSKLHCDALLKLKSVN